MQKEMGSAGYTAYKYHVLTSKRGNKREEAVRLEEKKGFPRGVAVKAVSKEMMGV